MWSSLWPLWKQELFWIKSERYICLYDVHMETSPLPVKGCTFWPMLGAYGLGQWGFFSVPVQLWHGASVYNGHLRVSVTLIPIAERLAVALSRPVFTTWICRGLDSNTQPSAYGAKALTHCATVAMEHYIVHV